MIKRLVIFVHWLRTGEGFFPIPEKLETPVVQLTVTQPDSMMNAATALVAGSLARNGHAEIRENVSRALELHKLVSAHLGSK